MRTIRPNLLFEGKVGYLRVAIQSKTVNDGKNTANDLGFPCNAASCVNIGDNQTFGLPRLVIQGFQELGDAIFVPLLLFNNTFQYNGALTWTKGAHNFKFGGSLIRRQFALVQSARPRGEFTFNATAGNAPAPLNFGLANFIVGAPVTIIRQASLYKPGYRTWESGFYAQDDWRVNKWLTLNIGARYDIYTAKTEQYNRLSNFDPATSTILVAGQNGVGKTAGITTDYGNIAPRFGFAATLGNGMVLRGGIGLSFFQNDTTSAATLKNIPLTSALTCGTSTTGSFANNNCPAGIGTLSQGVPRPLAASGFPTLNGVLNLATVPPSTIAAQALDFQTSYNLQYNVILEKQFGNNVINVGYVGYRGYDLAMNIPDINRALPSGTATANPRPYAVSAPRVTTIGYFTASGNSTYHALQMSFNRRFGKGLSITSGYNFGQSSDNVTGLGTSTGGYGNFDRIVCDSG